METVRAMLLELLSALEPNYFLGSRTNGNMFVVTDFYQNWQDPITS